MKQEQHPDPQWVAESVAARNAPGRLGERYCGWVRNDHAIEKLPGDRVLSRLLTAAWWLRIHFDVGAGQHRR